MLLSSSFFSFTITIDTPTTNQFCPSVTTGACSFQAEGVFVTRFFVGKGSGGSVVGGGSGGGETGSGEVMMIWSSFRFFYLRPLEFLRF